MTTDVAAAEPLTLDRLNAAPLDAFVALLDGTFERSLELRERAERTARPGPLGDPGRVLVRARHKRDEVRV